MSGSPTRIGQGPSFCCTKFTWPELARITRGTAAARGSFDNVVEAEEIVGEEPGGEVVVVGRGGEVDEGVGTPEHGGDGGRIGKIGDDRLAGGGWTAIEARMCQPRASSSRQAARPSRPADPVTTTVRDGGRTSGDSGRQMKSRLTDPTGPLS